MRGLDGKVALVTGLLRGAALYGGPIGVRVNAVAPGIVPTDLFAANASVTGEVVSADGGAAATSIVRPSGGAGAWDPGPVDRRLHPELAHDEEEHR